MSDPTRHVPIAVLIVLQTVISAASLVVEIVAGRMLAPYVGMSLYTWTSVIAVVLAGFSLGHWWGGRIAGLAVRVALRRTAIWTLAGAVATAAALPILRALAGPVVSSTESTVVAIAALTVMAFFLPSLCAGIASPVLAQISVHNDPQSSGRALGAMFAAGAFGAIAGTLLAGFFFISWLGTAWTLAVVTASYLGAALVLFLLSSGWTPPLPVAGVALVAAGLSTWSATHLTPCVEESRYFCIRVLDVSANKESPVRRMVLDHLSHGTSARDAPLVMFSEFTAMIDAIARYRMTDARDSPGGDEPRAFASFFIGGGTYSVPRAWEHRGLGPITVAEIDPAVTRIAERDFWLDTTAMTIIDEDARVALSAMPTATFDVIVGDAFGDIAVPSHLVTREFFLTVREKLKTGGVFLMNVVDFPPTMAALASITRTLQDVFPNVEVWTRQAPPAPGEHRVFVLVASSRPSRFASIEVPAPSPTRFSAFEAQFVTETLSPRGQILTDDYAPIDRLLASEW